MREWEFQQARLHHKDSAKFTKLTPREASVPFNRGDSIADFFILVCSIIGSVVIVLLLLTGMI